MKRIVLFISHNQDIARLAARMNGVVGNILSESKDYLKKDTAPLAMRLFILGLVLGSLPAAAAMAAAAAPGTTIDLSPYSPVGLDIWVILCNIANAIFEIAIAAAVVAFLVASFYYLTAYGNDQRITKAKGVFVYVVYGVAVAILAWGAAFIIAGLLSGNTGSSGIPGWQSC